MDISFNLNPGQWDFFNAKEKQVAAISGLGAGKTFVLVLNMIINEILPYPQALHCFVALSHQQLLDVSLPLFESFLEQFGIGFDKNISTLSYSLKNKYKTKVIFRSADQSNKMRSVEIGSLAIEELSYMKRIDFLTFLGRLRDKNGSCRLRTVFTPLGKNHAYHFFFTQRNENKKVVRMSTYDNKHLPDDYIQMLKESYDEQMIKQELEGEFINSAEGVCYYSFSSINVQEFPPAKSNLAGMDFNVSPLTAVVGFRRGDTIYIQDEMFLKNSNTYEASDYLYNNFGTLQIAADSTGNSRRSSSSQTDHQILTQDHTVLRTHNPHIKDRYNCVNNLLAKNRLVINPRCVHLIKDLEEMVYNNTNPMVSHISDALGYLCWHLFPIQKPATSTSRQL